MAAWSLNWPDLLTPGPDALHPLGINVMFSFYAEDLLCRLPVQLQPDRRNVRELCSVLLSDLIALCIPVHAPVNT